jgi:hypothetical protein
MHLKSKSNHLSSSSQTTKATTPAMAPKTAAAPFMSILTAALPVCTLMPELVELDTALMVELAAVDDPEACTTLVTVELGLAELAPVVVINVVAVTAAVTAPAAGLMLF